jgi:DNA adenine methylase
MKPFVKWAGGKKQILELILRKIEECSYNNESDFTLIEAFVGGGVVFINSKKSNTIINDLNLELILTYKAIRNNPTELMEKLDEMFINFNINKEEYYYKIRAIDREENFLNKPIIERAARLIFLNKTCFNGLYRVNSEGYFNTPIGRNKIKGLYNKNNLLKLSKFFNTIPNKNFLNGSYKKAIRMAKYGDVIYLDPPYSYIENDGFTKYQKEGFSLEDLRELKYECDEALKKGAFTIISNNDTKQVRALFKDDTDNRYNYYNFDKINSKRTINSKGSLRNNGKELIIVGSPRNFPIEINEQKMVKIICLKNNRNLDDLSKLSTMLHTKKKKVIGQLNNLKFFDFIDNDNQYNYKSLIIRKAKKPEKIKLMRNFILGHPFMNRLSTEYKNNNEFSADTISQILVNENPTISVTLASKISQNLYNFLVSF